MAESVQIITNSDGTQSKVVTRTKDPSKGKAWIETKKGWRRPEKPKGDYAWDDDKGWVSKAAAATDYGFALSIINANTDLTNLFNEAWTALKRGQEMTEQEFKVKLQRTTWFKTRSEAQQKYYVLQNDPAQRTEFNAQVSRNQAQVAAAAKAIGINLDNTQLNKIANENLLNGWNQAQLEDALLSYMKFQKNPQTGAVELFGQVGKLESDIRDWAKRNGITVQDQWVYDQVSASAKNNYDITSAKKYITNIAKRTYASHADLIDDNNTASDAAAGFINSVQNLLEIPQGQVDINDKRVQQLMKMTNDKGTAMSTYDAEKWLRKRPEWQETKNAKETTNSIVNGVLSKFGFR